MKFGKRLTGSAVLLVGLGWLSATAVGIRTVQATSLTGQSASALMDALAEENRTQDTSGIPKSDGSIEAGSSSTLWNQSGHSVHDYAPDTDMILGGTELFNLMTKKSRKRREAAEPNIQEYAIDPATFSNWYQFSTNFSIRPELDEMLDFRAVAVARYSPEIQYWLEGNRWAEFGSGLPTYHPVLKNNHRHTVNSGGKPDYRVAAADQTDDESYKPDNSSVEETRVLSLKEFFLGMFLKLIKLPITYAILAVCLGAILISLHRQPRS